MLDQLIVMAAPTGVGVRDWIFSVAATIFAIVVVIRSVQYYAQREWGYLIGHIAAGAIVAVIVLANGSFMNVLKEIGNLILGTS
ncbi:hypothetical protein ACGFIF_42900 [Kribbella sp. NPDC049174]|uniref:hypothetical protein n=1 Tax=Kribbella sp. NPDC049174 TaxID=3364112 RepID=UPI00371A4B96